VSIWKDTGGVFSIHLAIAAVPLTIAVGGAIDYAFAQRVQISLTAAADASALAGVGRSTLNETTSAAKATAQRVFDTLSARQKRVKITDVSVDVTDDGLARTATVAYGANVDTSLLNIIGINAFALSGSSSATFSKAPYIDFYVLLDNSPSMGVGATDADIATMVANTSDKCAFACHDTSNKNSYYNLAKKLGVTMRIDVLRTATQQLMDTAKSTAEVADQFHMAVYTFGADATSMGLSKVVPLTGDLTAAKASANAVDLMTVPNSSYNNDMDTPMDAVLAAIDKEIPQPGDGGTPQSRQKIVFLVSDGVADQNKPAGCSRPLSSGIRCQEPLNPDLCLKLRNRGVKIAVLYTTYLPLPTNAWYNTWLKPFQSTIPVNMQACATPGLYFEVSPSGGIAAAMTALFRQAILVARLTQ
jgi:hypothetical protein